jgi:hypothetical protein
MNILDKTELSQEDMILEYLKHGNRLTPLEALHRFGCLRLGARIWDLKQRGYDIEMQLSEVAGGKHVAEYRLAKGDGETGRKGDSEIAINESEKNG